MDRDRSAGLQDGRVARQDRRRREARREAVRHPGAAAAMTRGLAARKALAAEAFARLAAANPAPKSELEYRDPYTLLVAVALSAQATDAGVNKATRRLFAEAADPAAMVALGEERVRELVKTIGLYRNKAKNVVALSRILVERHGGEVPRDREALEALPGVGRKTANVVLNVAFGEPTIAVDTHVFRVANRLGIGPGRTPEEVERALLAVTPKEWLHGAHHWLILHGRHVCKARTPLCGACALADVCPWPGKPVDAAEPDRRKPAAPQRQPRPA
ncbi:MAG: endonuclease III [Hyphomicrobiales bacterium]|nr:endonuclease III [Hyphomicrobiales bacterium]